MAKEGPFTMETQVRYPKIFSDGKHLRPFCFVGTAREVMVCPFVQREEGAELTPLKGQFERTIGNEIKMVLCL